MTAVIESVSANAMASGLSTIIAKPTGLAVGDFMIAQIYTHGGAGLSAPGDWSTYYNAIYNANNLTMYYGLFWKIADADDVAASDFTFTLVDAGGITEAIGGNIARISGLGIVEDDSLGQSGGNPSSPFSFASGIDPTYPDNLILFYAWGGDNSNNGTVVFSDPAIATSNPGTWTPRASGAWDDTRAVGGAFFSATRPEATAFGNASIAFSGVTNMEVIVAIVSIAPRVDGGAEADTGTIRIVNQPFLRNGVITVDGVDPEIMAVNKTQWTNQDKPAVSVLTNLDKP